MADKDSISTVEARILIKEIFEAAYDTNGEVTVNILRKSGPVTVKVDQSGSVSMSGSAGHLGFSVADKVKSYGVEFKYIKIYMSSKHGSDDLRYTAKVKIGNNSATIMGKVDVVGLIQSCSGLLCNAARMLKGFDANIERDVNRAVNGY